MLEIRFHGLGGHGAVVASKFLAEAAAMSGYCSQSFASYGALRRGGKVESYVRISDSPVQPHCKMYEPDCVVLMDETLVSDECVLSGLKGDGKVLINSPKTGKEFQALKPFEVYTIDAYRIANAKGLVLPGGMPVINTTLLGALLGVFETIRFEDLQEVIREGTPKAGKNIECALEGKKQLKGPLTDMASEGGSLVGTDENIYSGDRYPVYDQEKMGRCNRCQICYIMCPSLAISFQEDPFELYVNKQVCTGCGICIEECPHGVISWGRGEHD